MQGKLSAIESLWENFRLPIRDSLYIHSGESYDVAYSSTEPSSLHVISPFDLEAELEADPDWTSEVDGMKSTDLPGGGLLWAGDGSYGSEGFFARLTTDRLLVWAVFLMDSNSFTEIIVSGGTATFISTADVVITVNIDDPRGMPRAGTEPT